jgi:hypothetical protein
VLALDDPRWAELSHAYGPATDTPTLLRRVAREPADKDAWSELFGSICHQGSAYPASYAAVPHIVEIAAQASPKDRVEALALAAGIAMAPEEAPPLELAAEFHAAIARIPPLAEESLATRVSDSDAGYLLVAMASGHGCARAAWIIELYVTESDLLLRCPDDDCAVEISASPDQLVVDEDATPATPTTARGAPWTEPTAATAAADAAERAGRTRLAAGLRGLAGTGTCPVCEAHIEIWPRLLAGDDL